MEKEFVTYNQALALKELGFDEPCIGWHNPQVNYKEVTTDKYWAFHLTGEWENFKPAPLYQQAFKWFREKYGLHYCIIPEFYVNGINFNWQVLWYLPKEEWTEHNVNDGTFMYGDDGEYPTQELAESACIDKMIEIVKNKQD